MYCVVYNDGSLCELFGCVGLKIHDEVYLL